MELEGKVSLLGKALLKWPESLARIKGFNSHFTTEKDHTFIEFRVGLVGNSHEEYYLTRKGQATETKTCVLAIETFEVAYRKCREQAGSLYT